MKSFNYVIKDKLGVHARPAGLLVNEAKRFNSSVKIKKGDSEAEASQIFKLMNLGIKYGEEIGVIINGEDENHAADELEKFFKENL